MDGSGLLLLLKSSDALAANVDEALMLPRQHDYPTPAADSGDGDGDA